MDEVLLFYDFSNFSSLSPFCTRDQKIYKLVFAILCLATLNNVVKSQTVDEMKAILASYDRDAKDLCNKQVHANWDVATDQQNALKKEEQVRKKVEEIINFCTCSRVHPALSVE